jgi:hypothetical protein
MMAGDVTRSLIALKWPHLGAHLKLRMKLVESPHRTSFHPQKDLHHNSQGMTENYLENVTSVHSRTNRTNLKSYHHEATKNLSHIRMNTSLMKMTTQRPLFEDYPQHRKWDLYKKIRQPKYQFV